MVHDLYDYLKRNLEKMDEKQLRKMKRELQGICFMIDQLKKAN